MFRKITKNSPLTLPDAHLHGIVIHWTAGHYDQAFDDYHFCVSHRGEVLQNDDALPGDVIPHTWRRNTGTVGISAMAMVGATEDDYGSCPVTDQQIEAICALCARLMHRYGIPLAAVLTHAECARLDGYPGERWDFLREGEHMRQKIAWYYRRQS